MLLPSRGAVPAPAGKGGSDRAAVLVGEPAQEVAKGLLRCRGGDVPAVVPDHVAEPEPEASQGVADLSLRDFCEPAPCLRISRHIRG